MNAELQLRDIHLPPEPSWWPPAPGWWVLAVLLALLLWAFLRWALRQWRARRQRLALNAEFDSVLLISDVQARLAGISALLRRAARWHDPAAATLAGDAWLAYLDRAISTAEVEASEFRQGPGRIVLHGPFCKTPDARSLQALTAPARRAFLRLAMPPAVARTRKLGSSRDRPRS